MLNKLKVLFIGVGSIGKRHLKNIVTVANSCNIDLTIDALRSSFKPLDEDIKEYVSTQYMNYEDISNYVCVFITNPTYMHFDTIKKLKNKAKYFFIEKPLDSKPLSDEELKVFDKKNIYYVACPLRHTKVFKTLQNILKDKKVYCARAICSSYLPNWRKDVDYRKIYSAKKESGGVKVDLIHDFDYLFSLFGLPKKYSLYSNKISNLDIESCDYTSFIGEYNDMYVELHLDYFGRGNKREVEIYTEDDVIIADFVNSKIRVNNVWENLSQERNDYCIDEIKYFLLLINNEVNNINDINYANNILKIIGG